MADASSSPSDTDREEMLDRMLTRLALADDSQLEALLPRILPYSLSSLSSSSTSVRKLVLEILSHVNKRVKHRPDIGLPFDDIWRIYIGAGAAPMVRNFCIVYVEMAFERLPKEVKANAAPDILANIAGLPQQHQDITLRTVSKVIGECHSSHIDESIAAKYRTTGSDNDKQQFLEFCLHTILYQPVGGQWLAGLSVVQSDRVTGKLPLKGDALLMRKLGTLNVIEAMQLAPELTYPLYVAAASDSQEPVAKRGEELLKRKASGANLDDPDLIKRLFMLFNGSVGVENVAEESKVAPANPALRARLMSVFCRSITAANSFPLTLQCIFGCIYGGGTTSRLKQLGMEFTVWVFKHARTDQLKLMGPVILSGILKSLDSSSGESESTTRDIKTFAFQAIGLLASLMPHLFRDKIDMAVRLFAALKFEDQSLRLTIQEAVTSLAVAYKDAPLTVLNALEGLLPENSQVIGAVHLHIIFWLHRFEYIPYRRKSTAVATAWDLLLEKSVLANVIDVIPVAVIAPSMNLSIDQFLLSFVIDNGKQNLMITFWWSWISCVSLTLLAGFCHVSSLQPLVLKAEERKFDVYIVHWLLP